MSDEEKLKELNGKTYREQAKWFLNAFWTDMYEGSLDKAEEYVHAPNHQDFFLNHAMRTSCRQKY